MGPPSGKPPSQWNFAMNTTLYIHTLKKTAFKQKKSIKNTVSKWWQIKQFLARVISIFAVNVPLKLFRDTVADVDIGSLKSLLTFLCKYLCIPHADEI